MKITLVRHAETEWNYDNKMQGTHNIELNDRGIRQAKRLKDKLRDKHFDYCYMSPLIRTVQTAIILIGDRVETIPDKRLIERGLGELEGKSRDLYDVNKFWDYNLNSNDYGVEPVQDVFKRCEEFLDYIKNKYDDDTSILIVSHGAPVRALHHILSNTDRNSNLVKGINISTCFFLYYEI